MIIVALSWSFISSIFVCIHMGNAQDLARGYAKSSRRELETLQALSD